MSKEYTITEFASESKDLEISISTLHFKEAHTLKNGNIIVLSNDSILEKYRKEFATYEVTRKLTDEEFRKYQYNPQLLSFDLYETTELWFLLLDLNNLYSLTQFDINPVKVYNAGIISLINTIINLEQDNIDQNENEITLATK